MPSYLGKLFILAGLVLVGIGILITFGLQWKLGRLPGDITVSFKYGRIFVPLTTCLLISLLLTLALWLIAYFRH